MPEAFTGSTGSKMLRFQSSSSSLDSLRSLHERQMVHASGSQQILQQSSQDKPEMHAQLSGPETPPRLDTFPSPHLDPETAPDPSFSLSEEHNGSGMICYTKQTSFSSKPASHIDDAANALDTPASNCSGVQQASPGLHEPEADLKQDRRPYAPLSAWLQQSSKDNGSKPDLSFEENGQQASNAFGDPAAAVEESLQLKRLLERQAVEWEHRKAARQAREKELLELTFQLARKCIAAGEILKAQ